MIGIPLIAAAAACLSGIIAELPRFLTFYTLRNTCVEWIRLHCVHLPAIPDHVV